MKKWEAMKKVLRTFFRFFLRLLLILYFTITIAVMGIMGMVMYGVFTEIVKYVMLIL